MTGTPGKSLRRTPDSAVALFTSSGRTRSEEVYQHIFEQISLRKWAVGCQIPTEKSLCEAFGVSRVVVREALTRLQSDGLLVSRQGSGRYVQRQPDSGILRFAPVGNIGELLRCFEFRVALEGEAALLAAQRRSPEDVVFLEARLVRARETLADVEAGIDADIAFHLAVAQLSGNGFFVTTLRSLAQPMRYGMQLARRLHLEKPQLGSFNDAQSEHRLVLDAIRAGNGELARIAVRTHIENTRARILDLEWT